jgi:hypothetical protein
VILKARAQRNTRAASPRPHKRPGYSAGSGGESLGNPLSAPNVPPDGDLSPQHPIAKSASLNLAGRPRVPDRVNEYRAPPAASVAARAPCELELRLRFHEQPSDCSEDTYGRLGSLGGLPFEFAQRFDACF